MSDDTSTAEYVKLHAEAEKFTAEAAKARVETEIGNVTLDTQKLFAANTKRDNAFHLASDLQNQVFRLRGAIDGGSAGDCIEMLTRWSRINPGSDMTLVINSPGGYVTAGMDLFDTVLELRGQGHEITGIGRGYVASMGSVLLQACDWRVMGPGCAMLIHEPSGMAMGSIGEIEDTKSWLDMIAKRMLDVYAERCEGSAAEQPFTRAKLKAGWNRKDWWLSSDQALKGGLIDAIQ